MNEGGYLTLQVTFGGGREAEVHFSAGVMPGEIDLHRVMATSAATQEVEDIVNALDPQLMGEIKRVCLGHLKGE